MIAALSMVDLRKSFGPVQIIRGVSLDIAKGGYLEFCSRRGCKAHAIGGTGNIDDMMSLMHRMFETPYD